MNGNYNMGQLRKNVETALSLEWLGVRFEDTREEKDAWGFMTKTSYYYSVPESSIVEVEDEKLNERIKTADGLKRLAKEMLTSMILDSCEQEFGEDPEFIVDVTNHLSDYFKFYAKVRTGEVWTKELGDNRIKELTAEMQRATGYVEI